MAPPGRKGKSTRDTGNSRQKRKGSRRGSGARRSSDQAPPLPADLTPAQREQLEAVKEVLGIRIDGDWTEEMVEAAFQQLDGLLSRMLAA